jgi:hypothetical protein
MGRGDGLIEIDAIELKGVFGGVGDSFDAAGVVGFGREEADAVGPDDGEVGVGDGAPAVAAMLQR